MNRKINYLEAIPFQVDFDHISLIAKIINNNEKKDCHFSFDLNEKKYEIKKDGCVIDITCNDGRKLRIDFCIDEDDDYDDYGSMQKFMSILSLRYHVFDGSSLDIISKCHDIIMPENYIKCLTGEMIKDDISKIHYSTKHNTIFDTFNEDIAKGECISLKRTSEGIKTENNFLISKDFDRIISLDGNMIPSKEEIEKYDADAEKKKYRELIESSDLESATKKELINKFNVSNLLTKYKEIMYMYSILPDYKSANDFIDILAKNEFKNYMFSFNEMGQFVYELCRALNYKLDAYTKELTLLCIKKMNEIYDAISPEDRKIMLKSFF